MNGIPADGCVKLSDCALGCDGTTNRIGAPNALDKLGLGASDCSLDLVLVDGVLGVVDMLVWLVWGSSSSNAERLFSPRLLPNSGDLLEY